MRFVGTRLQKASTFLLDGSLLLVADEKREREEERDKNLPAESRMKLSRCVVLIAK